MATYDPKDELAGTEAPFVSHLVELRDRLLRAGDMRSGRQGAPEQPGLGDGEPEAEPVA